MAGFATGAVYEDDAGQWRWRVQAANGEIVAVGEAYTRREDAERGLAAAASAFYEAVPPEEEV